LQKIRVAHAADCIQAVPGFWQLALDYAARHAKLAFAENQFAVRYFNVVTFAHTDLRK
jgi:hypothetical protein